MILDEVVKENTFRERVLKDKEEAYIESVWEEYWRKREKQTQGSGAWEMLGTFLEPTGTKFPRALSVKRTVA